MVRLQGRPGRARVRRVGDLVRRPARRGALVVAVRVPPRHARQGRERLDAPRARAARPPLAESASSAGSGAASLPYSVHCTRAEPSLPLQGLPDASGLGADVLWVTENARRIRFNMFSITATIPAFFKSDALLKFAKRCVSVAAARFFSKTTGIDNRSKLQQHQCGAHNPNARVGHYANRSDGRADEPRYSGAFARAP